MNLISMRSIYLAPRALGIVYALFISLFALDAFNANLPLTRLLMGFAIHLVPTGIILIVLALGWKWEWLGSVGFIALGLIFTFRFPRSAFLIISGPAFLVGLLFLVSWTVQRNLRPSA